MKVISTRNSSNVPSASLGASSVWVTRTFGSTGLGPGLRQSLGLKSRDPKLSGSLMGTKCPDPNFRVWVRVWVRVSKAKTRRPDRLTPAERFAILLVPFLHTNAVFRGAKLDPMEFLSRTLFACIVVTIVRFTNTWLSGGSTGTCQIDLLFTVVKFYATRNVTDKCQVVTIFDF